MRINSKSGIFKRIILVILVITVFNAVCPLSVEADSWQLKRGGGLLKTIFNFLVFVGDSIMDLLQDNFVSPNPILITAKSPDAKSWDSGGATLQTIGLLVAFICVSVILAIATAGVSAVIQAFGTVMVCTAGAVAGGAMMIMGGHQVHEGLKGEYDIPMILYEPYTIFSGQVPAFDVNFLHPNPDKQFTINTIPHGDIQLWWKQEKNDSNGNSNTKDYWEYNAFMNFTYVGDRDTGDPREPDTNYQINNWSVSVDVDGELVRWFWDEPCYVVVNDVSLEGLIEKAKGFTFMFTPSGGFPKLSGERPEDLIKNYMSYTRCEAENPGEEGNLYGYESFFVDGEVKKYESTANILQKAIATWYIALRRIAIVVLLSMLVYVGIKIIIASAADQKAKYKRFFIDWLVALCMLFVLHYIMIFILTISTGLTKIFITQGTITMVEELPDETSIKYGNTYQKLHDINNPTPEQLKDACQVSDQELQTELWHNADDGKDYWTGGYMGFIRLMCGWSPTESAEGFTAKPYVFSLLYLVLVIDTLVFTFMYIKRTIMMAFLTMIAPLIAVTYPIDKMKDQQAQAFGIWIKEYTFNALIQPVHLIIYTMLISLSINLAKDYPVYAVVALGFIIPAEKFLRKMFGFENAETLSPMGAAAGGALLYSGIQKLAGLGKRKEKDKEEEDKKRSKDKRRNKITKRETINAG